MLDYPLLRYLFGCVRFRVSGGFAARFMNLCDSEHLHVWHLQQDASGVAASVAVRDYRRLRVIARRAGMTLCCLEKHGVPFFLRQNRSRVGLLAGVLVCAALAVFCSGFLWTVEVTGGSLVSEIRIREAAAQIGLFPGAKKPKDNGEVLAIRLQQELDGALSWAAVNLRGSRAVIEVRDAETQTTLPDPPFGAPCDLVADFDGQLLSLEVHSGRQANEVGNGVKKGDLLISGTQLDREGKPYYYEARGIVTALHEDIRSMEASVTPQLFAVQAVRRVPVLHVWHLTLPLGFFPRGGTYSAYSDTASLRLHAVTLPFSLETRTRIYWSKQLVQSMPLLFDSFVQSCNKAYANTRVLSGEVSVNTQADRCLLKQQSRVIDFMGQKRPLQTKD